MGDFICRFSLFVLLFSFVATARAAEHQVASADEIARAAKNAKPGDVLVMKDGTWKDEKIAFKATGTKDQPVTLRAATPGKVVLTGGSRIAIDGQWGVVSGIKFGESTAKEPAFSIRGSNNRVTE